MKYIALAVENGAQFKVSFVDPLEPSKGYRARVWVTGERYLLADANTFESAIRGLDERLTADYDIRHMGYSRMHWDIELPAD